MKADEVKRLKKLEVENRRMQRLIGELELDEAILKQPVRKKLVGAPERPEQGHILKRTDVSRGRACERVGLARCSYRYEAP